jgi:hypothetical protein
MKHGSGVSYDLAARGASQKEGRLGVLDGLGRPLLQGPLGAGIPGFSVGFEVRVWPSFEPKSEHALHLAQHVCDGMPGLSKGLAIVWSNSHDLRPLEASAHENQDRAVSIAEADVGQALPPTFPTTSRSDGVRSTQQQLGVILLTGHAGVQIQPKLVCLLAAPPF